MSSTVTRAMLLHRFGGGVTQTAALPPALTRKTSAAIAGAVIGIRLDTRGAADDAEAGAQDPASRREAASSTKGTSRSTQPQQQQQQWRRRYVSATSAAQVVMDNRGTAHAGAGLGATGSGHGGSCVHGKVRAPSLGGERGGARSRGGAGFGFAARGLSTGGSENKDLDALLGLAGADGIDPEDLPADDILPASMTTKSWIKRRATRVEKGNYEGMNTEIDTLDDFEPEHGDLYNMRDADPEFNQISGDASDEQIQAWADEYW
jgi:hypothetical protein